MIWVVGGTTEAIQLGEILKERKHIITYGTREGVERGVGNSVYKRMTEEEMEAFIDENQIDLILDVTHPFAKNVTENVKLAAKNKNIKYLRYERKPLEYPKNSIIVNSYEECYKILENKVGVYFFTTGSNNVIDFERIKGHSRYIYRILPTSESVTKVRNFGVNIEDIVAMLGPFSIELNTAMLKFYNAEYMVMKDSGETGGTTEKLKACVDLDVIPIIISRNSSEYISDWDEFIDLVRMLLDLKN